MFGLLSPPLCYPEKLAGAQSAQGSSEGNSIGVIKRAALEKAGAGLGCQSGRSAAAGPQVPAWPLPPAGDALHGRPLVPESIEVERGGQALRLAVVKSGILPRRGEMCLGEAGTRTISSVLCYLGYGPSVP